MVKKPKPVVWVISTDSTGEMRCRQGIAAKINPDFSIHNLQGKTPAAIKRHYISLFETSQLQNHANWPDFIISSGIRSTKAARTVKKLSSGKTFIIQNLKPKDDLHLFDLVAIPEHLLNEDLSGARNYIGTIGVPHFIT
jgi:mitochondrial fission protein ELM1